MGIPNFDMLAHSSQDNPPEPSFSTPNPSGFEVTIVFVGFVRAFYRSSLFVEEFELFRISRDGSKDSEIPLGFGVDDSTIRGRGAFFREGAGRDMRGFFKSFEGATELETTSVFAEAPIGHREVVKTDRSSVLGDLNGRRVSEVTLIGFV